MIIRKQNQDKENSIIVGIWFTNNKFVWENGNKSMRYNIPLTEIKNYTNFQKELERFLINYVKTA